MTATQNGLVMKSVAVIEPPIVVPEPPVVVEAITPRLELIPAAFDPAVNDVVKWKDGTFGVVKSLTDEWLEDGDVVVTYDEKLFDVLASKTWCVQSGALVPSHDTRNGQRVLIYAGHLG